MSSAGKPPESPAKYNEGVNSQFTIVNPCPKRWTDLRGSGRVRFCDVCQKQVHAIDQYAAADWNQIWHESQGHVCGLLGGGSPPQPRTRRAVLVGVLLTAVSPLMAKTGRLRIRVIDELGSVIVAAEVSLLGRRDKPKQTAHTDGIGEVVWVDLPMGDCRFAIEAPGFERRVVTATLRNDEELKIDTTLVVATMGEVVFVGRKPAKKRRSRSIFR